MSTGEKTTSIHARKKAEEALRESEAGYQQLFENMVEGFASCRLIYDEAGSPCDFVYLSINKVFEELTGLKDVVGKRVSEVIPGIRESNPELLEIYGRVGITGQPERFETFVPPLGIWFSISVYSTEKGSFVAVFDNITARKNAEAAQSATIKLLRICNEAASARDLMHKVAQYFQLLTECEAIGVRLREGDDFPYYETRGFPEDFVLAENSLCSYDQKGDLVLDHLGHPALDCMCGNVLCCRVDPSKPFFTPQGSFWSSCTTELLASTTDADRQAKTRNRCNGERYETVALIPLRTQSETFGLFQFNDSRKGRFTAEKIALLENLVDYVSIALSKLLGDEALDESNQFNQQIIDSVEEGVIVYDKQLRVKIWNPFMERLTGFSAQEVVEGNSAVVFPFLADTGVVENLKSALSGRATAAFEFPVRHPRNGVFFWISGTSAPLRNTKGEIIGVIQTVRDMTAKRQANETLRKLSAAVEQSPTAIVITDIRGNIEYANPRFTQLTGYKTEEVYGQNPRIIKGDTPEEVYRDLWATIAAGRVWEGDFHNRKKDGTFFWEHAIISPIRNEVDEITHYLSIKEDITERRSLEEQLRQSQKMEAIGTLAGGIAHDFNNILTAIIGYSTLLQMEMEMEAKAREYVDNIMALSERAGNLTKGLLAFSRNQVMHPRLVNLNDIVTTITKLTVRLLGESIEIETHLSPAALIIMADCGEIEQILMNLATNARDAMPAGGKLMLSTDIVNLEPGNQLLIDSGQPGVFALLSVSDTGIGMDEQLVARIFEPFFTTKEPGKGTGLGLSILYGILQQHNGIISVASRPDFGTTFNIYLPLVESGEEAFRDKGVSPISGGSETILIAEDDAAIRTVAGHIIRQFGYRVIETADGKEAVEAFRRHAKEISLAVIDLIMPRKNGSNTFQALVRIRPDIKTIFVSGYPSDFISQRGLLPEGAVFLAKPVSPMELLRNIRQLLDKQ